LIADVVRIQDKFMHAYTLPGTVIKHVPTGYHHCASAWAVAESKEKIFADQYMVWPRTSKNKRHNGVGLNNRCTCGQNN
jgi:hypothetical protein